MNEYEKYKLQWMIDHDVTLTMLMEQIEKHENYSTSHSIVGLFKEWEAMNKSFFNEGKSIGRYQSFDKWIDREGLLNKYITPQMLEDAYFAGILKIIPDDYSKFYDSEPIAQIGDHWFYFAGNEGEEQGYQEYLKNTPIKDIIQEIYVNLESIKSLDSAEFLYYYYYITERLEKYKNN